MNSATDPESEYEALMHVVNRLKERFPHTAESELRELTAEEFQQFDDAHVRDFVPVLVERAVADRLHATAVAAPPAAAVGG
ncbi:three-helix bundle dimerization domain-containing protein [Microbacterium hominis]|uniref:Uncharacterized protein n=1 Tax=Microbacterium hominis TaxID=162426 RepID=A0A7D4Q731_9MICO|nr:hypothetical protein [Microbacterium hominis]QKJ18679.1 hypothetical protein HQM25_04280 [Microbacterium hominis]